MGSLSLRLAPSRFADPAFVLLVALGIALFFALRGPRPAARAARAGRVVAWIAWGALWVLSTPTVADTLVARTEIHGPDLAEALAGVPPERTALVVLAAGMRTIDPSVPPRERLDSSGAPRSIGAARLYEKHRFGTVVLSGGPPAESEAMNELVTSLGIPASVIVREESSVNTRENALFSAKILRERAIDRVVLATSATHLRRAMREFERAGVKVIPAALDVIGSPKWGIDALLPASFALWKTHRVLHEIFGLLKP